MTAIAAFALWEAAVCLAALRIARGIGWPEGPEKWLGVLAVQVTLESSFAGLFSFAGWNSPAAYWLAAAACALAGFRERLKLPAVRHRLAAASIAALAAPLLWLAFRPVEEIDSINYLHYLIEWMANRATPYTFATNYVAFWELSFLPVWTLTGLDIFFPILALKAVVILALALWLVGREIGQDGAPLLWTIFAALVMRHYWFEYSGVPTLKNDVLHGAGFVLLTLAVLRAAARKLEPADIALLALGTAFVNVKYTGIFLTGLAAAVLLVRGFRSWLPVAGLFLATSGHYYLRSIFLHGSPFYPFQINLGPIHLPGTADLSYSSILYNLHDPRLWRALFLPAGGLSPAGLLFPAILAATLIAAGWRIARAAVRRRFVPLDWLAAALLCGWLLYFRSVFSASGGPGDLAFILNGLNSIRYVDGVLAASELFLAACLGWRIALPLVAVNGASRLFVLYSKLSPQVLAVAMVVLVAIWLLARTRWMLPAAIAGMVALCPLAVERNRAHWTTYWNDLKPGMDQVRSAGLAELAVEDGGYFAGHVVAAGNPVHSAVRTYSPEELEALSPAARPEYLALLVTPGSEVGGTWQQRYFTKVMTFGYSQYASGRFGMIFRKTR